MTETDIAALEARVQQLEEERATFRRLADQAEIRRVLLTYQRGQDRGAGDIIASIYHEDALDFHGGHFGRGVDYGAHSEKKIATTPRHFTMHFMGDTLFEWDDTGDVTHTETYVRATHGVVREGGQHFLELFFGRYLDRFERRDGVWKIAERVTMRDYMCDIPVAPTMPERKFQGSRSREDASFAHMRMERLDLEA